ALAHRPNLLVVHPGRQDVVSAFCKFGKYVGEMSRIFAGTKDHLRHSDSQRAMVIHLCESQIFERHVAKFLDSFVSRDFFVANLLKQALQFSGIHGNRLALRLSVECASLFAAEPYELEICGLRIRNLFQEELADVALADNALEICVIELASEQSSQPTACKRRPAAGIRPPFADEIRNQTVLPRMAFEIPMQHDEIDELHIFSVAEISIQFHFFALLPVKDVEVIFPNGLARRTQHARTVLHQRVLETRAVEKHFRIACIVRQSSLSPIAQTNEPSRLLCR